MKGVHVLERVQFFPLPPEEVFPFFERPENLESITPSYLNFRILTPSPVPMHEGALIDYRLRLFGIPVRWRTRIASHEPGEGFVDEQVRGPYRRWVHRHRFEASEGGTRVTDRVEYALPFGFLGGVAHALWVRRLLAAIFDHRAAVLAGLLGEKGAGKKREEKA
jgi:ligand-binding SRPBCC domain-containing protein